MTFSCTADVNTIVPSMVAMLTESFSPATSTSSVDESASMQEEIASPINGSSQERSKDFMSPMSTEIGVEIGTPPTTCTTTDNSASSPLFAKETCVLQKRDRYLSERERTPLPNINSFIQDTNGFSTITRHSHHTIEANYETDQNEFLEIERKISDNSSNLLSLYQSRVQNLTDSEIHSDMNEPTFITLTDRKTRSNPILSEWKSNTLMHDNESNSSNSDHQYQYLLLPYSSDGDFKTFDESKSSKVMLPIENAYVRQTNVNENDQYHESQSTSIDTTIIGGHGKIAQSLDLDDFKHEMVSGPYFEILRSEYTSNSEDDIYPTHVKVDLPTQSEFYYFDPNCEKQPSEESNDTAASNLNYYTTSSPGEFPSSSNETQKTNEELRKRFETLHGIANTEHQDIAAFAGLDGYSSTGHNMHERFAPFKEPHYKECQSTCATHCYSNSFQMNPIPSTTTLTLSKYQKKCESMLTYTTMCDTQKKIALDTHFHHGGKNHREHYIPPISSYETLDFKPISCLTTAPSPDTFPVTPYDNPKTSPMSCLDLESIEGPCMEEMKRIILKEVVKDVDVACSTLNINPDPQCWSEEQVEKWVGWTANQYKLPVLNTSLFCMDGRQLCALTEPEMRSRAPRCGDILHAHLEIWRTVIETTKKDNLGGAQFPSHQDGFQSKKAFKRRERGYDTNENLAKRSKGDITSELYSFPSPEGSPSEILTSPDSHISHSDIVASNSHGYTFDLLDEDIQTRELLGDTIAHDERSIAVMTPNHTAGIHLWQFLKELLLQPHAYGQYIRWVDKERGIFKIEDSVEVARLWGIRKNRPAMNYDKLSRSIRQYYKKGIIKKTEVSQRLVYQFVKPVV